MNDTLSLPVTSQRHPFYFHFSVWFAIVFFIAMAVALLFLLKKQINTDGYEAKLLLLPMMSALCMSIAIYTPVRYYRNVPVVRIDSEKICFDTACFNWKDLQTVSLNGKRNFPYVIGFPMEGIWLQFAGGEIKVIYDDMYSNSWAIKSAIAATRPDLIPIAANEKQRTTPDYPLPDDEEVYKGNFFLSFRSIFFLFCAAMFFVFIYQSTTNPKQITGSLLMLPLLVLIGYQLNYVVLRPHQLVVKNHVLFWKVHAYSLDDIREVVFETKPKMPNYLRVITNDYNSRLYAAGTLYDKHWLSLKAALEQRGIPVRNECI